ncbi:hypothetical protein P4K96_20320, partial [Bacillus cereus]|nr:hypothetical protein [Bacillus cereus]
QFSTLQCNVVDLPLAFLRGEVLCGWENDQKRAERRIQMSEQQQQRPYNGTRIEEDSSSFPIASGSELDSSGMTPI